MKRQWRSCRNTVCLHMFLRNRLRMRVFLAVVPQVNQSVGLELLPAQRTLGLCEVKHKAHTRGDVTLTHITLSALLIIDMLKLSVSWHHPDLGVAPLCDALPAEEVSTGGWGGVSPLLQTEDTAGSSGARALCVLGTGNTVQRVLHKTYINISLHFYFSSFVMSVKYSVGLWCWAWLFWTSRFRNVQTMIEDEGELAALQTDTSSEQSLCSVLTTLMFSSYKRSRFCVHAQHWLVTELDTRDLSRAPSDKTKEKLWLCSVLCSELGLDLAPYLRFL